MGAQPQTFQSGAMDATDRSPKITTSFLESNGPYLHYSRHWQSSQ